MLDESMPKCNLYSTLSNKPSQPIQHKREPMLKCRLCFVSFGLAMYFSGIWRCLLLFLVEKCMPTCQKDYMRISSSFRIFSIPHGNWEACSHEHVDFARCYDTPFFSVWEMWIVFGFFPLKLENHWYIGRYMCIYVFTNSRKPITFAHCFHVKHIQGSRVWEYMSPDM